MAKIIICKECGQEKKHKAFGLCRTCYSRRWNQENPEGRKAIVHRFREANPDYHRLYLRRFREANPDYYRRYYQKNKEKHLALCRCYREENPEKRAAFWARHEARKKALPDTLTLEQAEYLFMIGRAMYPGEKLSLDHIVPLSKGGGTTLANIHAIPTSLNCSKHDALPQEIYRQLGLIL